MDSEEFKIMLPIEMAIMIRGQVETGAYPSNSALIHEALDQWKDRQQDRKRNLDAVRLKLDQAAQNPDRGSQADVRHHFEKRLADASDRHRLRRARRSHSPHISAGQDYQAIMGASAA